MLGSNSSWSDFSFMVFREEKRQIGVFFFFFFKGREEFECAMVTPIASPPHVANLAKVKLSPGKGG